MVCRQSYAEVMRWVETGQSPTERDVTNYAEVPDATRSTWDEGRQV